MTQTLWKPRLKWNEVLPILSSDLSSDWLRYSAQLKDLDSLDIKRKAFDYSSNMEIQLHGFSDVTEKAYGAYIYMHVAKKARFKLICYVQNPE